MLRSSSSFRRTGSHFFQKKELLSSTMKRTLLGLTKGYSSLVNTRVSAMQLPIGYDNFRKVIENKLDFVDKSLFVRDVIDNRSTEVAVFTRQRRFGKTLNLSMLHNFLSSETDGQSTKGLFDTLKIAKLAPDYMQHQGKYPVVFVTFKDIKQNSYKAAHQKMIELMVKTFGDHYYLKNSDKLLSHQKRLYLTILDGTPNEAQLENALQTLTQCLHQHHGIKPWVLIDEYDTPIQSAYVNGYYEQMIDTMRGIFGAALKTNPCLDRAVITGILRVAKESLFSGVNNLEIYSLLRPEYGQYFGFTEEEVDELLKKAQLTHQSDDIKAWYNGYKAGDVTIYNPWSVMNCLKQKGALAPYWVNTSDNQLIRNLLIKSSSAFKANFELLLQNKPIERIIDENTVFGDLETNESAAWSLLLMAGYLKPISQVRTNDGLSCQLAIPNQEVRDLYQQIIKQWLSNGHGIEWYNHFLDNLLTGQIEEFQRDLTDIMERIVGIRDTSHDPEAFYHGLVIGLTASLSRHKNYEIQSNRESGYGFYDYLIFSKDDSRPTIVLEFKKVQPHKDPEKLEQHLQQAAKEGLAQIARQHYLSEAEKRGATNILKISLAFCGKRFHLEHEHIGAASSPKIKRS